MIVRNVSSVKSVELATRHNVWRATIIELLRLLRYEHSELDNGLHRPLCKSARTTSKVLHRLRRNSKTTEVTKPLFFVCLKVDGLLNILKYVRIPFGTTR
jgi:hypothetical protein